MSLNERTDIDPNGNVPNGRGDADVIAQQPNPGGNQTTNHFFHFDGIYLPKLNLDIAKNSTHINDHPT